MSNNSFLPEKVIVSRNSGNGYISEVFSFDTWMNINGFFAFIAFLIFVFFQPWISGIILLLYCLEISSLTTPIKSNIFGILYSSYLIFDIKKEWFFSIFIYFFYEKKDMGMIIAFNFTAIIIHTLLLVFGEQLYKRLENNRFLLFLTISSATCSLFYLLKILFH